MKANEIVELITKYLGGKQNVISVTNCMTRLRVVTKEEKPVDEAALSAMDCVLGLVHDRPCSYEIVVGPGKSRQYADICHDMGMPAAADSKADSNDYNWKHNKQELKAGQNDSRLRSALKVLGDIFVPLIPGVIAAGLCAGFAALIAQLVPDYSDIPVWNIIFTILSLINVSFMTYITAWAGYRAAERFGATPILGGMLGLITSLDGINTISQVLGLFNNDQPLQSILRTGKGGILAVIIGVLILSVVEKKIRSVMPDSLDIVFTPLLSLLIVTIPYIIIVMPIFGYVSSGIVWILGKACMAESAVIRMITGYISSALFLPMVAAGMHHGMVALYSVQLQELGFITLYPALAMAGAGQVGTALAIMKKAKQKGNQRLVSVIRGAVPAGFLGVGEPLIYGVTLPLGKPFITAGLGAGFGGAFVMLTQVASTTWGPSGLLGIFVMTEGPRGTIASVVCYLIGLLISYVMSYIITSVFVSADITAAEPEAAPVQNDPPATDDNIIPQNDEAAPSHRKVKHGDPVELGQTGNTEFTHVIKDPLGIHARPAGELSKIIKKYNCRFTIEANGHSVENGSVLQLMSLGALQGTELRCRAEGPDAAAAARDIRDYMNRKL